MNSNGDTVDGLEDDDDGEYFLNEFSLSFGREQSFKVKNGSPR